MSGMHLLDGGAIDLRLPMEDTMDSEETHRANSLARLNDAPILERAATPEPSSEVSPISEPEAKSKSTLAEKESALFDEVLGSSKSHSIKSGEDKNATRVTTGSATRSGTNLSRSKSAGPPEHQFPPMKQALLVLIGIYFAVFLIALDRTILGTAIPRMTDEFHSFDDIGWYQSCMSLHDMCSSSD